MRLDEIENQVIFVDLDGVLADFDAKALELTGKMPDELGHKMWPLISDIRIENNSFRHDILKKLGEKSQATLTDLGFAGGYGSKQVNTLIKQGFIRRLNTNRDALVEITDKGKAALKELGSGKDYTTGPDFYNSLDKMPDAMVLWDYVRKYKPTILTGKPLGNWAEPQKRKWVAREIGPRVPVIVCFARDKAKEASEAIGTPGELNGAILIDDRESARAPWEALGGKFILHTSAANSVAQLKGLGV